ncbi:MAG: aminotransferase class I/II-fold pyridoxal phosphate-dependent enzyme [Gemmatimonadaceae bacterium]
MHIREFALERFFAEHEFAARHVLAASDVEGIAMSDLLAMADEESARMWSSLRLGYTESTGLPALRAEIARLYEGFAADDVLTFAGAEEAIYLTMHAALARGDHVVAVWPAYQSLHEVARSIGADVSPIPLDPRDWSLDVDRLADTLRPNTRMVVINFPHNPTGAHIDRAQLDAIVRLCRDRGIVLFSDEVYRLLEHDGRDLLPPAATLYDGAISLGVMSKSFALAGLRVGWIVSRDAALRARVAALKDYTTICNSAPSEILALMALRAGDRVLARSRDIVRNNLPILRAFMERHAAHLSWSPPHAGSVCFPRFTVDIDAERVAREWIQRTGVVILPGARFQFDRAHFRVGFGRHDTAEGLALIDPLIEQVAENR